MPDAILANYVNSGFSVILTFSKLHISILGRLNFYIHRYIRGQNGRALGVITTEGQIWSQQRRFALKHLRHLVAESLAQQVAPESQI